MLTKEESFLVVLAECYIFIMICLKQWKTFLHICAFISVTICLTVGCVCSVGTLHCMVLHGMDSVELSMFFCAMMQMLMQSTRSISYISHLF